MKKIFPFLCAFLLLIPIALAQDTSPKELDAYISAPDDSYGWKVLSSEEIDGQMTYSVELTSQTWHGFVWKHGLYIVQPAKNAEPNFAMLFITGGAIDEGIRPREAEMARLMAKTSGMTCATVLQVPNQPLMGPYYEDDLITETYVKALATQDWTWPLLFPMAKSAIRAMDAVQEILKEKGNQDVKKFVVYGGSKRGWTTWMAAASKDKRIAAIAPMVINTLNMKAQTPYQVETWGDYSEQIADYTRKGLVQEENDPAKMELKYKLFEMVDPYSYRSRCTMPKLLVHGANDPYWTVDAMKFYWDDLRGPKYTITLPNAPHNLGDQRMKALQTIAAFARYVCTGGELPPMTWRRKVSDDKYTVSVSTEIPAESAKLWTATSATKDLRKSKWESKPIKWDDGFCSVDIPKPASGHIAYYVELELKTPQDMPASLTTQVWRDGE